MKSLRMQTIASFIEPNDNVADIGCDHAYLSIFLAKNHLCNKIIATDINENALQIAKENIKKNHLDKKIKTYLSDGLQSINDLEIDTVVLAGMGTSTILHIIDNMKHLNIKKYIIQSNNDLPKLRKSLRKQKIYLQKEKVVYEKKHYYPVGIYTNHYTSLNLREKWFGKYDMANVNYYQFLNQELTQIRQKLKRTKKINKKWIVFIKRLMLKKYL